MKEKTITKDILKYSEAYLKCFRPGASVEEMLCRVDRHNELLEAILKSGKYKYTPADLPEIKKSVTQITDNLDREIGLPLDSASAFDAKLSEMTKSLAYALLRGIEGWEGWKILTDDRAMHLAGVRHDLVNAWMPLRWLSRREDVPVSKVIEVAADFMLREHDINTSPFDWKVYSGVNPRSMVSFVAYTASAAVIRCAGTVTNDNHRDALSVVIDLIDDCLYKRITTGKLSDICEDINAYGCPDILEFIKVMEKHGYYI